MITPRLTHLDFAIAFTAEEAENRLRNASTFRNDATLLIDVGESPMGLFHMIICSADAIQERRCLGAAAESSPIGWYLFCSRFSADAVRREIDRRLTWCSGKTEDDALAKLCLWFAWEGNRYRPPDAPGGKQGQLPWHQRSATYYRRQAERDMQRLRRERGDGQVICLVIDPDTAQLIVTS